MIRTVLLPLPCVALLALLVPAPAAQTTLTDVVLPRHSTWKYLDDGSDQGTAWILPGFDDSVWLSGPAHLGYGDGDEATEVGFGPSSTDKFPTTYFRTTFEVADPSPYTNGRLELVRDDGAIVYLNGTEIARSEMAALGVDYLSLATSTANGSEEDVVVIFSVDPALLVTGTNTLAAEVHQRAPDSSDISFDLELTMAENEIVIRGPYLQRTRPDAVTLRWRTDSQTLGRLRWGAAPGSLTNTVDDNVDTFDHEITLTGLSPATQYYYDIGTPTHVFEGGDVAHTFTTAPPIGSTDPFRVWVVGDSGSSDSLAASVRDAFLAFNGGVPDFWLMLGDNAYDAGSDAEYESALFDQYADVLQASPAWPTRGNHDDSLFTYWTLFTLPTLGEAGGVASNTESYYSFDWGNVHFLCLDSEGSSSAPGGVMWSWAEADLLATTQEWIVAYWHHPPYSKGSHDSDLEDDLIDMRENILPLLEDHGVDLVLNGHSHSYERSMLIDGHYEGGFTFEPCMVVDDGDGDPAGDGAYRTPVGPHNGTVYAVAGSSGKLTDEGPLNHPVMVTSLLTLGSLVLDVDDRQLDVSFLDATGVILDTFRLEHVDHDPWTELGNGLPGLFAPKLSGSGTLEPLSDLRLAACDTFPFSTLSLVVGFSDVNAPFKGGVLVPAPDLVVGLPTNGLGQVVLPTIWPSGVPSGISLWFQGWAPDFAAPHGLAATGALRATTP